MNPYEQMGGVPTQESLPDWEDQEKALQFGWIEHRTNIDLAQNGSTEESIGDEELNEQMMKQIATYGDWLRNTILTDTQKKHFLSLYAEDPEKAFAEIDQLLPETLH